MPAGALADIFDKRKYLIVVEVLTTAVSAVYAVMVSLGLAALSWTLIEKPYLRGKRGALRAMSVRPPTTGF